VTEEGERTVADVAGPVEKGMPRRFGPWRAEVRFYLELFAIAGLAVAQPILDLLSKNVSIFVTRRATSLEVVVLALVIAVVPPTIAWLVEVVIGAVFPAARRWVHALLVGLFAGLLAEQAIKRATELGPGALIALGVGAAVVALVLVIRFGVIRQFLRYLAVAPVIFVAIFLFSSPASAVVTGSEPSSLAGVKIGNPKRVVMIVMDEFPLESLLDGSGKIDAALYPNFAALAGTSTWYRNDTSVAPFTEWAVPAIMTGHYPTDPSAVPLATDYPNSIFRLFGGAYRMNVHESITHVCPTAICPETGTGEDVGFLRTMKRLAVDTKDLWFDFAGPTRRQHAAFAPPPAIPPQAVAARQFIASLRNSATPTVDFVHLLLPHQPWRYLPTLQEVGYTPNDPADLANLLVWGSQWSADLGRERHILQTMAADTVLGQIRAKLQSIGAWDNSIVVLTADHGEAFSVHQPLRSVTDETADQILWTPLFIKNAGQTTGVVDDRPMQSVDVLPTLAAMVKTKIPWKVSGVSALGAPRPEFPRQFYQWHQEHLQPSFVPVAPGNGHLSFDPARYKPKVLAARAEAPVGEPALRPYRIGDYANLIGADASPLVHPAPGAPSSVHMKNSATFGTVNPFAPVVPWAWLEGYVIGLREESTLAFAVNGKIAGFARATVLGSSTNGFYWASVAPQFFRAGANDVKAYVVTGPPDRPSLNPAPIN
jgi:uncharacterized membrane protein YeaQ/YmgE (transglycosylase-associated protein family)